MTDSSRVHPAVLPMLASFAVTALLAVLLARRPGKRPIHWVLLGLLLSAGVWTGAAAWRYSVQDETSIMAAYRVMFLGVSMVPGLWLVLAGLFARIERFESSPAFAILAFAPGAVFYLLFVTNEAHHWVARIGPTRFEDGPMFVAFLLWGYAATLGGLALLLARARFAAAHEGWTEAGLVVAAAAAPIAASLAYQLDWLGWRWDPTGAALGISAALLYPLIFKLGFLEKVPLIRGDVFEHLHDGVLVADRHGRLIDANPAAERLLGIALADRLGGELATCVTDALEPPDREPARVVLTNPADAGRGKPEFTTLGSRRVRISSGALSNASGDSLGSVVVLHDCTEERRTERTLRRAQKLESVGFLAAGVAHEVNNPLAFIRSNLILVQRLAEELVEQVQTADAAATWKEEVRELPEIVQETLEGVDRIGGIVEDMRRLSRDSTEDEEQLDVNDSVKAALRFAQLHRGGPWVDVDVQLAERLPVVLGSQDALVQVFLNLLLNARQALAGRPGRLRVQSRLSDEGVRIAVEDDGPGVPPEIQERIFDPFFTTKSPDEGTGLGLAIAYDIVREHKGTLELQSEPGRTVFTVVLPRSG